MAFNAWLVPMDFQPEGANPDWALLPTASDCWALPDLEGLTVYGLFHSGDSLEFEVRAVDPEFIMGREVFGTDFRRIGWEEGTGEIKAKGEEQPLFMFASRKRIEEGKRTGKAFGWDLNSGQGKRGLYTDIGGIHELYFQDAMPMFLEGIAVVEYQEEVAFPAYFLSFSPFAMGRPKERQNLTQELCFSREGGLYQDLNLLAAHKSPTLLFAGDIDGDGKTDLLMESSNCLESCAGRVAINLLLSSCAEEDDYLGLAAWYIGEPCF